MRRDARPSLASDRGIGRIVIVAGQACTHLYNPDHQNAWGPGMLRKDFAIAVMILSAMMAAIFSVGCTGGSGSQQVESMVVSEAVVEPTSVPTAVLTPSASSADASGEVQASETGPAPTIVPEATPTLTPTPQPTRTPTQALSPADVYMLWLRLRWQWCSVR